MKETALKLTQEEQDILDGGQGEAMRKVMNTVVMYGKLMGATRLVDLQAAPHLALSWSTDGFYPFIKIFKELADAGLKTYAPFTSNPKAMDHENLNPGEEKITLMNLAHSHDELLTEIYEKLGMVKNAWSCASFLPEVGNTPEYGDNISWTESSAIVFANSVLGARTNRNSMGIDMMTAVLGKAPYFGLMTDEGRKATWLMDCRLSKLPHPQLLGAAIGLKAVEDVPYIIGLDEMISGLDDPIGYLKDLGTATASNGAVGLFHVENTTPEAREYGRELLAEGFETYVIDDEVLEKLYNSYPVMWPDPDARPKRVFIGCPHNTLPQLKWWSQRILQGLDAAGQDTVNCPPYIFVSDAVKNQFSMENPELFSKVEQAGIHIARNCPVVYMSTPGYDDELIVTNSNKTRVYSKSRFYMDDDLVQIILTGDLPDKAPAQQS
ncbi:MAG: aconitase X [Halieaceae bacterium]